MRCFRAFYLPTFVVFLLWPTPLWPTHGLLQAASTEEINQSIDKGISFVTSQSIPDFEIGLAVYAVVKGSHNPNSPFAQKGVETILKKFNNGKYAPRTHHYYEAGIDAMGLEAVSGSKYQNELRMISDYIIDGQLKAGGWFYAGQNVKHCDTSITQYAILGLWAAARAGVEIPPTVWQNAARWHLTTQHADGSQGYQPGGGEDRPKLTMTAATCGSMAIAKRELFGSGKSALSNVGKKDDKLFGVLQEINLDKVAPPLTKGNADDTVTLKPDVMDVPIRKAFDWLSKNHQYKNDKDRFESWFYYYCYTLERVCALNEVEVINNQDWYQAGADYMIKNQENTGGWSGGYQPIADSCFCVLFLSQATGQIVGRTQAAAIGGGMLIGGRGLPDDLSNVVLQDGSVKEDKPAEGLDAVLKKLESLDLELDGGDEEKIDIPALLANPNQLLVQPQILHKLLEYPDPSVRLQVVVKLVQTDRIDACGALIDKLSDENWGIVAEAHRGLRKISRKPFGFGTPIDPSGYLDSGVEESKATPLQRSAAKDQFQRQIVSKWREWYQSVTPQ